MYSAETPLKAVLKTDWSHLIVNNFSTTVVSCRQAKSARNVKILEHFMFLVNWKPEFFLRMFFRYFLPSPLWDNSNIFYRNVKFTLHCFVWWREMWYKGCSFQWWIPVVSDNQYIWDASSNLRSKWYFIGIKHPNTNRHALKKS